MLRGCNLIGQTESNEGDQSLLAFSTVTRSVLPENFFIATTREINNAVLKAEIAFEVYKNITGEIKAILLDTIAEEIMAVGDDLIQRAILETGLQEARLIGERGRTIGQLKLFADLLREGSWVEAVIDTALPYRKPFPRADIRKMQVPIGPVVVFGASNFPFAFSTAGGDTASALAAGNPVIVKAHASHLGTNELVAMAINNAAKKCNMPDGVFSFVIGPGAETGMQLVKHPGVKAVGFTGSYKGGMAIYKAAVNEREIPIPVYAEMSSINPVLLLPSKLKRDATTLAEQIAGSVTLGIGQFCTNPGLIFLIEDESADVFIKKFTEVLSNESPATMLNSDVCLNYYKSRGIIAEQNGVITLLKGNDFSEVYQGSTALFLTNARDFINNPKLQNEMFGPATLLVKCKHALELLQAIESLHGQLTGTVIADNADISNYLKCIDVLYAKVGRIVYNGVPTGVEVCQAMVHGGPFPSTTDSRTTSVGADAIKRFVRPLCLQDCPDEYLPEALRNENPLNLMRKVNGSYTRESL